MTAAGLPFCRLSWPRSRQFRPLLCSLCRLFQSRERPVGLGASRILWHGLGSSLWAEIELASSSRVLWREPGQLLGDSCCLFLSLARPCEVFSKDRTDIDIGPLLGVAQAAGIWGRISCLEFTILIVWLRLVPQLIGAESRNFGADWPVPVRSGWAFRAGYS